MPERGGAARPGPEPGAADLVATIAAWDDLGVRPPELVEALAETLLAAAMQGSAEAVAALVRGCSRGDRALDTAAALCLVDPALLVNFGGPLGVANPTLVFRIVELAAAQGADLRPLVTAWRGRVPREQLRAALIRVLPEGPELLAYLAMA